VKSLPFPPRNRFQTKRAQLFIVNERIIQPYNYVSITLYLHFLVVNSSDTSTAGGKLFYSGIKLQPQNVLAWTWSERESHPQLKKERSDYYLIVAVCTPPMATAHRYVLQVGENIFCVHVAMLNTCMLSFVPCPIAFLMHPQEFH